jgi:hypothetical protein
LIIFLPDEYNSSDPERWLTIASNYLDDTGYQIETHYVTARSRFSVEPHAALHMQFGPKPGVKQYSHSIEQLHQSLDTKYTTAVYARYARGYAFDEVVGSQVRLAGAPGTPHSINPSKHNDWLRDQRIEYHSGTGGTSCFTLPATCDPEGWQHTLAHTFGAFVLREDTNWN